MKQEKNIETKAKSQNRKASPLPLQRRGDWEQRGSLQSKYGAPSNRALFPPPSEGGQGGGFKGNVHCKGPPGRSRSPDKACRLNPDNKHAALKAAKLVTIQYFNILIITVIQIFTSINFFIMKKQILFLAMFTLALIFAGTSTVFGQNPIQPDLNKALSAIPALCPAPTVVTCPSDALHPVPGNPYEYSIAVPTNLSGVAASYRYRWLVTQDPNIITTTAGVTSITANVEAATGTGLFVQSAVTNYNDIAGGSEKINITWKSFTHDPTKPVMVVIYVEGTDGCITNNIEVYEIKPIHAFTLDIANMAPDGTLPGAVYSTCVSPVESAIWTLGNLTMNYGTNYLYFSVVAANFTDSWKPDWLLTGNTGTRTLLVEWQYPALSNVATGWKAATDIVQASGGAGASVGSAGECIIVRVTVSNNKEETTVPVTISVAVDGVMNDPTTVAVDYTNVAYADIHYTGCLADGFTNDIANHILAPRPDIITTTVGVAPNTNPGPFIPKN
jgi:hypothetical protein